MLLKQEKDETSKDRSALRRNLDRGTIINL